MDVGMSLASALYELKDENPDIGVKRLIEAGMNIGRDMIGTMTNTLILAYAAQTKITQPTQIRAFNFFKKYLIKKLYRKKY